MSRDLLAERTALAQHEAESLKSGARSDFLLTAVVVALLVTAAAALWVAFVDTSYPQVRFDGVAAQYDGPSELRAGGVTFTFDARDSASPVSFVISELTDDSVTLADVRAYAKNAPADSTPDFVGIVKLKMVAGGQSLDHDTILREGRWLISVHTSVDDTNTIFPAALVEVRG